MAEKDLEAEEEESIEDIVRANINSMAEDLSDQSEEVEDTEETEDKNEDSEQEEQKEDKDESKEEVGQEHKKEDIEEVYEDRQEETKDEDPAPTTWRKQARDTWDKLPNEAREEIKKREEDFHRGIEQYREKAQKSEIYETAIEPYRKTLESMNVAPERAIKVFFDADSVLRNGSPLQKANKIKELIQGYGVDMDMVSQPFTQEHRAIVESQTAYDQQRNQAYEYELRAKQLEMQYINKEIEIFAKDKPHFEQVRGPMADLLDLGRAESLEDAYELAVRLTPELQRVEAPKQVIDSGAVKAAKQKAVQVKGSRPSASNNEEVEYDTIEEAVKAAWKTHTK